MSFLLGNEMIFIPLFGITVFIMSYFSADRVIDFLHRKSLGSREEVLALMDKMFIDSNRTKVTWAMLAGSFGVGFLVFMLVWPHFGLGVVLGSALTAVGWMAPKQIMLYLFEKRCTR